MHQDQTIEYPRIQPEEVFSAFAAVSRIPRESGHEQEIAQYLLQFAQNLGLKAKQDEEKNVYIYKPGTAGKENLPPLILQGHMDMVCVKTAESKHDFSRDPIEWVVQDDFLYANHTTLGADNGIAVAYSLALLASKDIPHPPLEVLITTAEETGMDGAMAVQGSWLQGKALLNLDAEEEGLFLTSCAGGANLRLTYFAETLPSSGVALSVQLEGLKSGHSGIEIHKQRANAIQLLGRLLLPLHERLGMHLASLQGGIKSNAIAAQAQAVCVFETSDQMREACLLLENIQKDIQREYAESDPNFLLRTQEVALPFEYYSDQDTERILNLIFQAPQGVVSWELAFPGLVRTSLNLGILRELEGMVELIISVRSSLGSEKENLLSKLEHLARTLGWQSERRSDYPAWEFETDSPLRTLALETYKKLFQKEATCSAIHAGLECGLLSRALPGCDFLSMGPDLYQVHTPQEHLSISSVGRTWTFLKAFLASYPEV